MYEIMAGRIPTTIPHSALHPSLPDLLFLRILLFIQSLPTARPTTCRSSGNLFWPDFWYNAWVNASIYEIMAGTEAPWEGKPHHRLVDSGQALFDRLRHMDVSEHAKSC